jgi:hypothetical protein
VAALDTRKSKEAIDPAEKMVEWMNTLKETGFDIRGYREAADARAKELASAPAAPVKTDVRISRCGDESDCRSQRPQGAVHVCRPAGPHGRPAGSEAGVFEQARRASMRRSNASS